MPSRAPVHIAWQAFYQTFTGGLWGFFLLIWLVGGTASFQQAVQFMQVSDHTCCTDETCTCAPGACTCSLGHRAVEGPTFKACAHGSSASYVLPVEAKALAPLIALMNVYPRLRKYLLLHEQPFSFFLVERIFHPPRAGVLA